MKSPKRQIAENVKKAINSGFRLQYGRHSPALATCRKENLVILGGLGAMGCGIMAFNLDVHGQGVTKKTPDFRTPEAANRHVIKEYGMGAINLRTARAPF